MLELLALEFTGPVDNQCCDLCNPAHFADYETLCVEIHGLGRRDSFGHSGQPHQAYVCLPCVRSMARALRNATRDEGVGMANNRKDRERWGRLQSSADEASRKHWAANTRATTRFMRKLARDDPRGR